jgi:iron complex outermembrane receptor protein
MTKRFYDIAPDRHATVTNRNLTLGARGEFLADWRYESTLGQTQTEPLLNTSFGTSLTAAKVAAAFANPDPARGPVLLYDSQRGPANAAGTIESLLGAPTLGAERNQTWTYDAKADGSAWDLPAGPVRIALGAEYREEYVDFPLQPAATSTARNRYTSGYFVETRVPLLSARQNWSWMYKLEATVALRHDRYSDFAATTNPRYGLLFQPVKSLILRGSYSEGYKVPTLSELYSPLDSFDVTFTPGSALDSLRGNQPIVGFVTVNSRGNSSLQPERSQSYTCGAVWDVPIIKGLSLALNFYDTRYRDRIDSISVTDRIVLFPSTVIRGPNLPGDQPGWAGPVTGYNDLPQNIATQRIAGYDLGVKYNRASSWGEVAVTATASRTTKNEIHSVPYLPPTITSTPDALPLQIVSSAFLTRGSWETGVIFSHRARNRTNTLPTTYFTPAVQRWDWQGSYNFGKARDTSDDHRSARDWVFADLRLSVTIFNVLNTRPPMAFTGLPDNTLVDSRLRRYALNLTKSF